MTTAEISRGQERMLALLLLVLGVGTRVLFAAWLPTQPVSDFRGIIDFALDLRDKSLFVPGYYWDVFNLGPPLALSVLLRVFPQDPEVTARFATAVWCGLMPVFPFVLWRRALPLWVRLLAGGLLALWPGQVFFSSVVAQDNWGLVPAVALACLAVPPLLDPERRPHPVAAGLLYALGVTMRQEMLFMLFPPLLAAAGLLRRKGWRLKNLAACALAAGLPFLALAAQRQKATGKFALSSGHAGYTLLGTVVPGATPVYWKDPVSFIATVEPDLVRDRQRMFSESKRIALAEVKRRPGFQALRVLTFGLRLPFYSDQELLYWIALAPGTQPETHASRAQKFSNLVFPLLLLELIAIQGAFLFAVSIGIARRNWAILVVALAVLLKIGLHLVLVSQARFYLPATALELPVIALGFWEASRAKSRWRTVAAFAGCLAASAALWQAGKPLYAQLKSMDVEEQRTYRFTLTSWEHPGVLRCTVRQGRLTALGDTEAVLETLHDDPAPGEKATADCTLTQPGAPLPLRVEVLDGYAPGGYPGRMTQRVEIDGREVVSHDIAAASWTGWKGAPTGVVAPGQAKRVRIEVVAEKPEPGLYWGPAGSTRIRVSPIR
jgi:hypothetical protein